MEETKCCNATNNHFYGCCHGQGTATKPQKYMQLYADTQMMVAKDTQIYFNDHSFGDFELTETGTIILMPGIYQISLNCQIHDEAEPAYISIAFYDLINKNQVGNECSRATQKSGALRSLQLCK